MTAMSARSGVQTSRSAGSYRKVAHTSHVDESLFGDVSELTSCAPCFPPCMAPSARRWHARACSASLWPYPWPSCHRRPRLPPLMSISSRAAYICGVLPALRASSLSRCHAGPFRCRPVCRSITLPTCSHSQKTKAAPAGAPRPLSRSKILALTGQKSVDASVTVVRASDLSRIKEKLKSAEELQRDREAAEEAERSRLRLANERKV